MFYLRRLYCIGTKILHQNKNLVWGKLKLPICDKTIYVSIKYQFKILLYEFSPHSQSTSSLSRKWHTLVRVPFSSLTVNVASTTDIQLLNSDTLNAVRGDSCRNGRDGVTNDATIASTKLQYGAWWKKICRENRVFHSMNSMNLKI